MPWEKSFNVDTVLDRATEVFWAKGYEAASMSDLIKATGINKGSMYNAFGSKNALFVRALMRYDQQRRAKMLAELGALNDPMVAIDRLFSRLVDISIKDSDKKGCLLVNTALDLPNHSTEVQRLVKKGFLEFERFFESQLELGKRNKTIAKDLDTSQTAKSLLGLVVGIRVLSRGVFEGDGLKAIHKQAIELIRK